MFRHKQPQETDENGYTQQDRQELVMQCITVAAVAVALLLSSAGLVIAIFALQYKG